MANLAARLAKKKNKKPLGGPAGGEGFGEEEVEEGNVAAGPKAGEGAFQKWAQGKTQRSKTAEEKPPMEIEDKLIDKIGEMRPGEEGDDLGADLGEDDELEGYGDELEPENVCWSGECSPMDMDEADVEELFGYLEAEEPEIHGAVMEVAEGAHAGDAEAVEMAKENLMIAKQMDPVYPEFDETQRAKAGEGIVEYISESGYPELGSPECNEAIAHALVEARGGGAGDEFEEDDEEPMPDESEEEDAGQFEEEEPI